MGKVMFSVSIIGTVLTLAEMKWNKRCSSFFLTALLALCLPNIGTAQSNLPKNVADSLWAVWNDPNEADTSRLKAIHDIAREGYLFSRPDSAFYYAQMELDFAEAKGLKVQMASALNTQGISFFFRGDYDKAIELYTESLERSEEAGDKLGMANAYTNIGLVRRRQGDTELALDYYRKGLALQEEVGNDKGAAVLYNNIGSILNDLGDIRQALDNHHKSLKLREKIGDRKGVASSYGNIGIIHIGQGDSEQAKASFETCLSIVEELGDKPFMASGYSNLGTIHTTLKNYKKALEYHQLAVQTLIELGDRKGLAGSYNNIAAVYEAMKDDGLAIEYCQKAIDASKAIGDNRELSRSYTSMGMLLYKIDNRDPKALSYAQQGLELAQELGYPDKIRNAAELLYGIYASQKNYKDALFSYELYVNMRDSIISQENKKELLRKQFEYDYDKKEALLAAEQEKKDAIAEEQLHRREVYLAAATGITFLLGIISLILFFFYRIRTRANVALAKKNNEISLQKEIIEEKNLHITDSIRYAERLQAAILPKEEMFAKHFNDHYILYLPKDIVSGDFYWMEEMDGLVFLAAADCTGHGVPGAMVSMVGFQGLNKAVLEEKLKSPAAILQRLSDHVEEAFEKSGGSVKDGMDICLVAIDTKTRSVTYAGAHNALWILTEKEELPEANLREEENGKRMFELKADRRSIGGFFDAGPFTEKKVHLNQGDRLFLFSDGFADQFGGPNSKKLGSKRMRETVREMAVAGTLSSLEKVFLDWKGEEEQIDDVTVISVVV
jgi:tetratricopeptide (TPR) repeat protein